MSPMAKRYFSSAYRHETVSNVSRQTRDSFKRQLAQTRQFQTSTCRHDSFFKLQHTDTRQFQTSACRHETVSNVSMQTRDSFKRQLSDNMQSICQVYRQLSNMYRISRKTAIHSINIFSSSLTAAIFLNWFSDFIWWKYKTLYNCTSWSCLSFGARVGSNVISGP